MTKTELTEIIRNVVREEIQSQQQDVIDLIREEIQSQLSTSLIEILAERATRSAPAPAPVQRPVVRQSVASSQRAPLAEHRRPVVVPQRKPAIVTKNPALNAVLAQTEGGIPAEQIGLMGPSALDMPISENTEVAGVQNVLMNKDFRGLVKAMDRTKGSGRAPAGLGFSAELPTSADFSQTED